MFHFKTFIWYAQVDLCEVNPFAIKHDFQILPLQFQSTESVLFGILRVMSGNYLSAALPRLNGELEKV